MLPSVEGVFRNGKIELLETPTGVTEARVIVTFLANGHNPSEPAILKEGAWAERRARLSTFAEDWERPEMDVYDAP